MMIRNKEFVIMWRWRIWTIWSGCGERTYKMCVALTPAHKGGKPNMDERISTKR